MQLLLINPNTTASVTALLKDHVAPRLPAGVTLHLATAAFGARYIADELGYAVAGHAALSAYALHGETYGEPDAVLLGCFGDPGVAALRELSRRPVVGLAEAAMREAAAHGRFAVVTGGAAWDPMLRRLARTLGFAEALAAVHVVEPTGAQLAADPVMARRVLGAACARAADGVQAVILGGAALAGMAAELAPGVGVPLIDSVASGARAVLSAEPAYLPSTRAATGPADWSGIDPALQHRIGQSAAPPCSARIDHRPRRPSS